jgi:predicted acyl esterase
MWFRESGLAIVAQPKELLMSHRPAWSALRPTLAAASLGVLLASSGCAPKDAGSATDAAADSAAEEPAVASSFGDYGPETPPFDGRNRYSLYIPMKDGVQVAIDYYLPTAAGVESTDKLPVVLHYTRYQRATEDETGKLQTKMDNDPVLQHLSRNGYAIAVADARGTGASFGVNNGAFSQEETADSVTIIEWLAAQPWSNGNIGMQGRSYPGMTQYEAATQGPPALKAIFAEMAGPTAYDFVFTNGTFKKDFVEKWGNLTKAMDLSESTRPARVDADTDGKQRDEAVAAHAKNLWAHDILSSPENRYRDFDGVAPNGAQWSWEAINTIDNMAELSTHDVAIYHLVGWYDIYTTQQPFLYESLEGQVPQKMMIGPWVHSGGYGGPVHKAEILRWYDHWLKGVANGIMDEEPVHYYVMKGNNTVPATADSAAPTDASAATAAARSLDETGAEDGGAWIATREWPPATTAPVRLAFAAGMSGTIESVNDGTLAIGEPNQSAESRASTPSVEAGVDAHQVDYTSSMGSFSRWMNGYGSTREQPADTAFFDERTAEDVKALTWTSEPLAAAMTIVGYPVVHLVMSSTHTDGDVFVYLEEVDATGASHYVTEGAIRASHRKLDAAPWKNFGLPFHRSFEADVQPLVKNEATTLDFDLEGTAIVIDKGHRIRITLAGADRANYELWPDPKGKDRPTITVHRGGDDASYVEVPVLAGGTT